MTSSVTGFWEAFPAAEVWKMYLVIPSQLAVDVHDSLLIPIQDIQLTLLGSSTRKRLEQNGQT